MKGFRALLQYNRMIDECLISSGTLNIESIKRMTTKGVQEMRNAHVTIRNVLKILISRLILVFEGICLLLVVGPQLATGPSDSVLSENS